MLFFKTEQSTENLDKHCIFWNEPQTSYKGAHMGFDGIPFMILEKATLDCKYGKYIHEAQKKKAKVRLNRHKLKQTDPL